VGFWCLVLSYRNWRLSDVLLSTECNHRVAVVSVQGRATALPHSHPLHFCIAGTIVFIESTASRVIVFNMK
jgi:hypothetical protein